MIETIHETLLIPSKIQNKLNILQDVVPFEKDQFKKPV